MTEMKIKNRTFRACALALIFPALLVSFGSAGSNLRVEARLSVNNEAEVRDAMRRAFERLRSGDYGGVYDALPSASQRRITRERFVGALERAQGMFELSGLELNRVHVSGDLAVVDTVLYARLRGQAVEGEGKIVSRQYMVREGGEWRVTTGERTTVRPLLAANPSFARQFPPTEPRVYFKRDGRWVSLDTLNGSRRRRG
jgi:hypothetical protein